MSRLMTITIVVRATGDSANPVDIRCNVDDESGLDRASALVMVQSVLQKVARDNAPDEASR